ncbi:MAG TPA: glycosyltransferase family 2 protein [Wenzhouxiangellaceae bacterium]|nr:glycosyltransferase family 2 protein [Wenzhouxiangellaceae bacterium]
MTIPRAIQAFPGGESEAAGARVIPIRDAAADVIVVIPARDEEADVGAVVRRVLALGLRAVVVDDHSSDRTREVSRKTGATVLELPFHAGSWAAIQAGMRYAQLCRCSHVVTLDADGQHNPEDIPELLGLITANDGPNVVIGACVGRANRRRRLAWRTLRWLSGLRIDDLTSGFRVYDRTAVDLLVSQRHTLIEYQDVGVLLCLHHADLSVVEVDVRMQPRCHGMSRIFNSWPMVAYYLLYSALIGGSRRRRTKEGKS